MDRRVLPINIWVTARYFRLADILEFVKVLKEFEKLGVKTNPEIKIAEPFETRRIPDLFFCTGVSEKDAKKCVSGNRIVTNCYWREGAAYTFMSRKQIESFVKSGEYNDLFQTICQHLDTITDKNVELRNIR